MSNIHEYVLFDRAALDRVMAMNWQQFATIATDWRGFSSAREFLIEWALYGENIERVDEILARKTIRATFQFCDQFSFLRDLLDIAEIERREPAIPKGDYSFGEELFSVAVAAQARGELSLAAAAAVYNLHFGWVDLKHFKGMKKALRDQPVQKSMLPGLPDARPDAGNGLNVSDTRRFLAFLRRAWDYDWPDFRTSKVASRLLHSVCACDLSTPCIFHWFEC